MMEKVYRPNPTSAIGNLSLCMTTHAIQCLPDPKFHKDCLAYGRDKLLVIPNVVDVDVPVDNGKGYINGFIHLQHPQAGDIMRQIIKPSELLQNHIDKQWAVVKNCVAGFHIRRGASAEDAKRYALGAVPFASQKAVDAMVEEANKLDAPVYVLSDSVSTKKYFKSKVPKAVVLDLEIGFTADEHSQKVEVSDEDFQNKINSFVEWFLLAKMPKVYMTAGGINGRNVDSEVEEGITSTFGYSAALYGGKIPWYVFNDGVIFWPSFQNKRFMWSDM